MESIASKLHVGRGVRFFAGYGGIDGDGVIVAVHGTPNAAPPRATGGIMRIIRADDCIVDVILFDGRRLFGKSQCSIDGIGIGIKLRDEVHDAATVANLHHVAAKREADEALERASAQDSFERREAARVIENPPRFYWNGIKDVVGGKLQRCSYSESSMRTMPAGTITIYARDYEGFSALVSGCFAIKNDSDMQTDYFDKDTIRVIPTHPLYSQVREAMAACSARYAKRAGGAA